MNDGILYICYFQKSTCTMHYFSTIGIIRLGHEFARYGMGNDIITVIFQIVVSYMLSWCIQFCRFSFKCIYNCLDCVKRAPVLLHVSCKDI